MEELQHPKLVALQDKFAFKNVSEARLSLHPAPASGEEMRELNPGEEVVLTGSQFALVYAHSIKTFRDCVPKKLEMRPVAGKKAAQTKQAAASESESEDQSEESDSMVDDESSSDSKLSASSLKSQIKELETEYKAEGTALERKQSIKEEIKKAKHSLKSLK